MKRFLTLLLNSTNDKLYPQSTKRKNRMLKTIILKL